MTAVIMLDEPAPREVVPAALRRRAGSHGSLAAPRPRACAGPATRLLTAAIALGLACAARGQDATARAREALAVLAAPRQAADSAARKQARAALAACGEASIPVIAEALASPSFALRWEAVNALGAIGARAATPHLVDRACRDENPHVRWRSIWALGAVRDTSAPARIAAIAAGDDPRAAWSGRVALAQIAPDASLVPHLEAGLASSDRWVRWEAVNALGRVRRDESIALVARLLDDPEGSVRREAAMTLGRMGATGHLARALDHADAGVRSRAALGLERTRAAR